jgi:peptidyl-prolyl cis-trans isomerase C
MLIRKYIYLYLIGLFLLASCKPGQGTPISPSPEQATATRQAEEQAAVTNTPIEPSPTPLPLAATINGQDILLSSFQAELARFTAAAGHEPSPEEQKQVLDDLIQRTLLAQAAAQNGYIVDETILQAHLDALIQRLGDQGADPQSAFNQWLSDNGYLEADFKEDLRQSIQAAWMRDQIIAGVPLTAEQIHARQIVLPDEAQANEVLSRLQAGANFENLASQSDPLMGGELGWFPRGYLFYPELETAAFALQSGQYTPVIQTPIGFHILQVIERDPARRLSPDALLQAQKLALQGWLEEHYNQAQIEILLSNFVNPG